ncbi:MAG: hypothetical protein ACRD18_13070 [Terriglobia bacterium]
MTKMRLLCFSLMLLVIAAMSMPVFGTTEQVSLYCNRDSCAGVTMAATIGAVGGAGATFTGLSIDVSSQSLPSGGWLAEIQTAGATTVGTDDANYDLWPGENAIYAVYAPGGRMVIIESSGSGIPFMIATFDTAQSQFVPTEVGENNPDGRTTFDGTFTVIYLDRAFFGGEGCPSAPATCGAGSIHLKDNRLDSEANLTMDVTPDPPTDPSPEPGTLVLSLLGAVFIATIIRVRGEGCWG